MVVWPGLAESGALFLLFPSFVVFFVGDYGMWVGLETGWDMARPSWFGRPYARFFSHPPHFPLVYVIY